MSPRTGGRDEGMPQAPDPIGLPDLAPARTEASPPTCPTSTNLTTAGSEPTRFPTTTPATTPTTARPRPDLRACGPDHLVSNRHGIDGSTLHRYAGRSRPRNPMTRATSHGPSPPVQRGRPTRDCRWSRHRTLRCCRVPVVAGHGEPTDHVHAGSVYRCASCRDGCDTTMAGD